MKLYPIDDLILAWRRAVRLYQSLILYDNIWKILTDLLQDLESIFRFSTQFQHKYITISPSIRNKMPPKARPENLTIGGTTIRWGI